MSHGCAGGGPWVAGDGVEGWGEMAGTRTYGNAIRVLLTDALGLSFALLEGVLVLELGAHSGG